MIDLAVAGGVCCGGGKQRAKVFTQVAQNIQERISVSCSFYSDYSAKVCLLLAAAKIYSLYCDWDSVLDEIFKIQTNNDLWLLLGLWISE